MRFVGRTQRRYRESQAWLLSDDKRGHMNTNSPATQAWPHLDSVLCMALLWTQAAHEIVLGALWIDVMVHTSILVLWRQGQVDLSKVKASLV